MAASQPVERPDSTDFISNKLGAMQRQIDELTRQSKYPFSISHNGGEVDFAVTPDPNDPNGDARVFIGNGAGQAIFETFFSTVYNGRAARMLDLANNPMWAHDELAGYGVSHPSMSFATGPAFDGFGLASVPNNTETPAGGGYFFAYNPALRLSGLVRPSLTTAFSYRWQVDYSGGTVFSAAATGLTGVQFCNATVLLPEVAMSHEARAQLLVKNTGGAQAFYYGHNEAVGVSMAQYNVDNGL